MLVYATRDARFDIDPRIDPLLIRRKLIDEIIYSEHNVFLIRGYWGNGKSSIGAYLYHTAKKERTLNTTYIRIRVLFSATKFVSLLGLRRPNPQQTKSLLLNIAINSAFFKELNPRAVLTTLVNNEAVSKNRIKETVLNSSDDHIIDVLKRLPKPYFIIFDEIEGIIYGREQVEGIIKIVELARRIYDEVGGTIKFIFLYPPSSQVLFGESIDSIITDVLQTLSIDNPNIDAAREGILRYPLEIRPLDKDCLLYTSPSPRDRG